MKTYHTVRSSERNRQMSLSTFNPSRLLDIVSRRLKARNDHHLSQLTGLDQATISRLRHRKDFLSAATIIMIMEETGLTLKQVYAYAGIEK